MSSRILLIAVACVVTQSPRATGAETPTSQQASKPDLESDPFVKEVLPFLTQYCADCHSGEDAQSGVNLTQIVTHAEAQRTPSRWNQIRGLIELGAMPPADHDPLPSPEERAAMAERIYQLVNRIECGVDLDAGRVTIRRLNAFEYDNTVSDLLGIEFRPSDLVGFPSDDVGNGFNNQGEVLSVSPMLLEKYLSAAEEVSQRAIEADLARIEKIRASATAASDAGSEEETIEPDKTDNSSEDDRVQVEGPPVLLIDWPAEDHSATDAARAIFERLLPLAYRRPVETWEVQRLVTLTEAAMARELAYPQAIGIGLQAALVSPHFLFRVEPVAPASDDWNGQRQPVSQFALASRLSYFLLASMPDEALRQAAAQEELTTPDELEIQTRRLLADYPPNNLIEGFFAQWLGLGGLLEASPDEELFSVWNSKLRQAMREETLRVCEELVIKDQSLLEFLNTEFTFMNPRMAEVYGVKFEGHEPSQLYREGPGFPHDKRRRNGIRRDGLYRMEDRWRKVPLPEGRRGILTHASVLTMTSNPSHTSPVQRGKWVLETLLGDPPPPAPPSVPGLEETAAGAEGLPFRKQLELHRTDPGCASCHQRMDPIGFALQTFDAMGKWRDKQNGHKIDAAGTLEGKRFNGALELIDLLGDSEAKIARNFAERLMVYALGRGLRPADHCAIDKIVEQAAEDEYRISAFIYGVVRSDPFRMRRTPNVPKSAQSNVRLDTHPESALPAYK